MKNTNKIKSIICVLLVFSMLCVTFTGCSSKKDDDTTRLTSMPRKGKSGTIDRIKTEYGKTTEWLR